VPAIDVGEHGRREEGLGLRDGGIDVELSQRSLFVGDTKPLVGREISNHRGSVARLARDSPPGRRLELIDPRERAAWLTDTRP
jgi:hypothetical protein